MEQLLKAHLQMRLTKALTQTMANYCSDDGTKTFNILQCASRGDVASLKRYHKEHVDMNAADYDGRRALHLAAADGHLECVQFLLDTCKVAHSPRDRWYHTPLDEAKTFDRTEVINYMDRHIRETERKEKGAKTYILLSSACSGDVGALKRLFHEGIDMTMTDYDGRTALHLAAVEGHLDNIKFLLEDCDVPHSPRDRWMHTPLDEARNAKKTKCVDYLQQFITKSNGATTFTVLDLAAAGNTKSLERMWTDGIDMQVEDWDKRTPLHLASAEGKLDTVRFLIEKCRVNANPKDRWDHTPLHEARNFKHDSVVRYLETYIASLNAKTPMKDVKTK